MARTMAVLAVFFVSLAIGTHFALKALGDISLNGEQNRERAVQRQVDSHSIFVNDLQETFRNVEAGWSLERAVEAIQASALENYPPYLANLYMLEDFPTVKEQVAHNVVRYFVMRQEEVGGYEQVLTRLRSEMADMFGYRQPVGNPDA